LGMPRKKGKFDRSVLSPSPCREGKEKESLLLSVPFNFEGKTRVSREGGRRNCLSCSTSPPGRGEKGSASYSINNHQLGREASSFSASQKSSSHVLEGSEIGCSLPHRKNRGGHSLRPVRPKGTPYHNEGESPASREGRRGEKPSFPLPRGKNGKGGRCGSDHRQREGKKAT